MASVENSCPHRPSGGDLELNVLSVLIAARNVFRHRARSLFAMSAIIFGVVALLISAGFIEWIYSAFRESVIQSRFGHLQIVRTGYFQNGTSDPYKYLIPDDPKFDAMLTADPRVRVISPRIAFSGLLSHEERTVSFFGEGVRPETENQISKMLTIASGADLSSSDTQGIIVGDGLATAAGLKVGDKIVLLVTTSSGGVNGVDAYVRGIFFTSTKAFDDASIRVPIDLARNLIRAQGAHSWVILLNDTAETDSAMRAIQANLSVTWGGLEVVPWYQLADFYNKTVELFSRQVNVVRGIIALIITFSISNTMTVSVLERTGEIGTLMAMGHRRRKILSAFLTEGFLLGVFGGILGLVVGIALAKLISTIGIPMPAPPGSTRGFTGAILLTPALELNAAMIVLVTAMLASLYPAWKASRMVIVDALRHNR